MTGMILRYLGSEFVWCLFAFAMGIWNYSPLPSQPWGAVFMAFKIFMCFAALSSLIEKYFVVFQICQVTTIIVAGGYLTFFNPHYAFINWGFVSIWMAFSIWYLDRNIYAQSKIDLLYKITIIFLLSSAFGFFMLIEMNFLSGKVLRDVSWGMPVAYMPSFLFCITLMNKNTVVNKVVKKLIHAFVYAGVIGNALLMTSDYGSYALWVICLLIIHMIVAFIVFPLQTIRDEVNALYTVKAGK